MHDGILMRASLCELCSPTEKFSTSSEFKELAMLLGEMSCAIDSAKHIITMEIHGFLQLHPPSLGAIFQLLVGVLGGFHMLQVPTMKYTNDVSNLRKK